MAYRAFKSIKLAILRFLGYALKSILNTLRVFQKHMVRSNKLQKAPPYPVETAIKRLGANLRLARLQRNLTIAEVAERIGTGPRAVMDAEMGKVSTGIVVYAALLWLFDELHQMEEILDPRRDEVATWLLRTHDFKRARKTKGLSNDF